MCVSTVLCILGSVHGWPWPQYEVQSEVRVIRVLVLCARALARAYESRRVYQDRPG